MIGCSVNLRLLESIYFLQQTSVDMFFFFKKVRILPTEFVLLVC